MIPNTMSRVALTVFRWQHGARVLAILALTSAAEPLQGQSSERLVDISPCIAVESAVARLDCYDELAERRAAATLATDSPAPTPSTPAGAELARASGQDPPEAVSVADTGAERSEGIARGARRSRERAEETPPVEIVGTVAALREIQPGRLEITLADGQVWRQTSSDRYRLQVGQEVRIYSTRFGDDYRLSAPAVRGFVQVRQVY